MDNQYAVLLKELLQYTQIKYGDLAEALGYDISYISKWVNGVRLPASKNIDHINQDIAQYVTSKLVKGNRIEEFSDKFMCESVYSEEDMQSEIYRLCMEAYHNTIRLTTEKKGNHEISQITIGSIHYQRIIKNTLKSIFENAESNIKLCITGDFCDLIKNGFWDFLSTIDLPTKPCRVMATLNLEKIRRTNMVGALYHCLDELYDWDISFYERTGSAYDNMIIVENELAIIYSLNEHGNIDMCVSIKNELQIDFLYHKCINYLSNEKQLIVPKKTLGMEPFGFRDMFFTSVKYFYFLAHGFEFLIPDSVFQSLIKNAKNGEYKPADENWVYRIQTIWKNLMDKAQLHFLVPSNSLIQYLETGYIHLNDFSYKLTLEERKQHLDQVLKSMKANQKIVLGILLPMAGMYRNNNFVNLSFYSNYSTAFFKKNIRQINGETAPIYVVNDIRLLSLFQNYFEEQMKSAAYHEYTYDQLSELYGRYKYLLDNLFAGREDKT